MRTALLWAAAILAGIVVLSGVVALVGADDDTDETVSALEWADGVCGSVAVWRGEMESILDGIRSAGQSGTSGSESGAETPQGRTGSIRTGLDRAITSTETMVEAIQRSGIPDTPQGQEAADRISSWADTTLDDLESAQDDLSEGADTVDELAAQIAAAAQALGTAVASGIETVTDVALLDPEVADALQQSETCQRLRKDGG